MLYLLQCSLIYFISGGLGLGLGKVAVGGYGGYGGYGAYGLH